MWTVDSSSLHAYVLAVYVDLLNYVLLCSQRNKLRCDTNTHSNIPPQHSPLLLVPSADTHPKSNNDILVAFAFASTFCKKAHSLIHLLSGQRVTDYWLLNLRMELFSRATTIPHWPLPAVRDLTLDGRWSTYDVSVLKLSNVSFRGKFARMGTLLSYHH
jgi:hypothetical protein